MFTLISLEIQTISHSSCDCIIYNILLKSCAMPTGFCKLSFPFLQCLNVYPLWKTICCNYSYQRDRQRRLFIWLRESFKIFRRLCNLNQWYKCNTDIQSLSMRITLLFQKTISCFLVKLWSSFAWTFSGKCTASSSTVQHL